MDTPPAASTSPASSRPILIGDTRPAQPVSVLPGSLAAIAASLLPLRPGYQTSEFGLLVVVLAVLAFGVWGNKLPPEFATYIGAFLVLAYKYFRAAVKADHGDDVVALADTLTGAASKAPALAPISHHPDFPALLKGFGGQSIDGRTMGDPDPATAQSVPLTTGSVVNVGAVSALVLSAFLAVAAFCGCLSTTTSSPSANIRNAAINGATGPAIQDAVQLLTQVGVNSIVAAVSKDTSGGKNSANVALEQNAAANLWATTNSSTVNFGNIVTGATAGKATQTAIEAAKLSAASTAPKQATAAAIATVISAATGAAPTTMGATAKAG